MSSCSQATKGYRMKLFTFMLFIFSMNLLAQEPVAFIKAQDQKIYSLKNKGIKDFVVDVENQAITKSLRDQKSLGTIDRVYFRIFWTASPERVAIEVYGLPQGFREVKEELKLNILPHLDQILPVSTEQRFTGYVFQKTSNPKEFTAKDTSGISLIPSFLIKYDNQDRLIEVIGNKPVGEYRATSSYDKESFSDGKWVLKSITVQESESGQNVITKKNMTYGQHQGIGVLTKLKVTQEITTSADQGKPLISDNEFNFKDYKINAGQGLQYFLADPNKIVP
jgi:hypothetical protein